MLLLTVGCGNSKQSTNEAVPEKVFTLEELAKYNGKDGNPAYVAVDGIVYDLTKLPKWKNGMHNGYEAGNDLTQIIKEKSPHGVSKLRGVPMVGKLAN
jgi:predicted heme/steroid binding protein